MKIVMVGPFGLAPKRTMAERALPLARALTQRGHSVTMLLPPWSNPSAANTTQASDGVTIFNLPLPPRWPVVFHLGLAFDLLRRTLALRPDIVHCFKPKAYSGLVAWGIWQLKRLGLTRTRLVVDTDDWEGTGGWNELEPYAWPLKKFFAWQERWGLTHADALTVASRALQTLAWSLGVPRHKVHYVPNGMTDLPLAPKRLPTPPTLLLYTRFFEFGLERIARLFITLAARHPHLNFLIVGQGLFGEDAQFLKILHDAGLQARTTHLGWLSEAELPAAFARTTVAIYPFDDTLLNRTKCAVKLRDLLCAGVPTVAEAVGQNAEYISHGESGLLVRPNVEAEFSQAVSTLLDDEALRARISAAARERMHKHFRWSLLVEAVEQAYAIRNEQMVV